MDVKTKCPSCNKEIKFNIDDEECEDIFCNKILIYRKKCRCGKRYGIRVHADCNYDDEAIEL